MLFSASPLGSLAESFHLRVHLFAPRERQSLLRMPRRCPEQGGSGLSFAEPETALLRMDQAALLRRRRLRAFRPYVRTREREERARVGRGEKEKERSHL